MNTPHPLDTLLEKLRKESFSERSKGTQFEKLIKGFLQTDPTYDNKFSDVWLWSEFPYRNCFGGTDLGIDIVCKISTGDYWAVQCKFFDENTYIDKPSVDTFLSTSSRTFTDDETDSAQFTARLWVSTSNNWSSNATETIRHQQPQVQCINMSDLYNSPIEWDKLAQGIFGTQAREAKKKS